MCKIGTLKSHLNSETTAFWKNWKSALDKSRAKNYGQNSMMCSVTCLWQRQFASECCACMVKCGKEEFILHFFFTVKIIVRWHFAPSEKPERHSQTEASDTACSDARTCARPVVGWPKPWNQGLSTQRVSQLFSDVWWGCTARNDETAQNWHGLPCTSSRVNRRKFFDLLRTKKKHFPQILFSAAHTDLTHLRMGECKQCSRRHATIWQWAIGAGSSSWAMTWRWPAYWWDRRRCWSKWSWRRPVVDDLFAVVEE